MNLFQRKYERSPKITYSRSKELLNTHISKQRDLALYNSSNFNVYLYKNSPNRGETPIKPPPMSKTSKNFFAYTVM